ncbi:MAG: WYL domain-containing protein, partial [Syntrophaceae bacterium]|nr:WYL domain-containing protein [Syntrophaceae bacterium]
PVEVKIRFCAAQAPYIRERRWCKKQQMEILDDGTVILTLHTSGWYDVKKWLLSFGANAEILEPDEKRKEVQEEIKRMASQYTKKGRSSKNNHV